MLEVVENAQYVTATTRHAVRPSVLPIVSSTFSTHETRPGRNAVDGENMYTDNFTPFTTTIYVRERFVHRDTVT